MADQTKATRLIGWLGSRELVSWKEGASYFLVMAMISTTFFFLGTDVYPPVFGTVLLVMLITMGILNHIYWNRKAKLTKEESGKT